MNLNLLTNTYINEVWNSKEKNLQESHKVFSNNAIINSPLGKKIGRDCMQTITESWLDAFSNIKVFDINLNTVGNSVIAEWRCQAIHENMFQLIRPTHKKVEYAGTTIFCFNDKNEIVSYLCSLDLLKVYEQLGFVLMREKYEAQKILSNDKKLLMEKLGNMSKYEKSLTNREIECLCFLLNGYTAKKIASKLKISHRTVEEYIHMSMIKLQCHNKNHLIELMHEEGMVHIWYDLLDLILRELKNV